jgi:DNA-binding MarR family transcriptional regulator
MSFAKNDPAENDALSVRAIVALYRQFESVARHADISLAQYRMMLYLRRGPRRAGIIAAAGAVKKPTVSAMLTSLREKGWVSDATDPDDARAVAVSLTKEGRARLAAFEKQLAGSMARLAPNTSLHQLKGALVRFYGGMAETEDARLKEIEDRLLS